MRQPVLVVIAIVVRDAALRVDAPFVLFRQPAVAIVMVKTVRIFADAVSRPSLTWLPTGSGTTGHATQKIF